MLVEQEKPESLPGLVQFWSQRQDFCLAGQPARVSRVERDAFQIMPDPQFHQVVAGELLAELKSSLDGLDVCALTLPPEELVADHGVRH